MDYLQCKRCGKKIGVWYDEGDKECNFITILCLDCGMRDDCTCNKLDGECFEHS